MSTTSTAPTQERIAGAVRKAEDGYLQLLGRYSDLVARAVSATPAPLRGWVPSTQVVIGGSFNLAERLLEANRQFAAKVIDAATPRLDARNRAAKPAAAKTTAA